MKIRKVCIDKLNPAEYNPRLDLKKVMQIMRSLKGQLISSDVLSLLFGMNQQVMLLVGTKG